MANVLTQRAVISVTVMKVISMTLSYFCALTKMSVDMHRAMRLPSARITLDPTLVHVQRDFK